MNSSPVVLLGAGASRDAGLPLARELSRALFASEELYRPRLGYGRPARARALVGHIHRSDPSTADDYELFFRRLDQIDLLFPSLGTPGLRERPDDVNEGMALVLMNAPTALANLLRSRPVRETSYLARIAELGQSRSLRVFSLNYDSLLRDACEQAGLRTTTGFDREGKWRPGLLNSDGIVLHHLHGSLRW